MSKYRNIYPKIDILENDVDTKVEDTVITLTNNLLIIILTLKK